MKILGLDISLTGTGLCIVDFDTLKTKEVFSKTLSFDLVELKKTLSTEKIVSKQEIFAAEMQRILYIEKEIINYSKNIDFVVIENYAFGSKFNREKLGEITGILKRRLYLLGIPILLVDTSKVKKILTGDSRNPTKSNVKKWVLDGTKNRFGIDFQKRDDECDSFGLALIGLFYKKPNLVNTLILDDKIKEDIFYVLEKIEEQKKKKQKKNISYYFHLPYDITVFVENNIYVSRINYLEVEGKGVTIKKSLIDLEKQKRLKIRELRSSKKRITLQKKKIGRVSFLIKKN